jgi:hypothetical protein
MRFQADAHTATTQLLHIHVSACRAAPGSRLFSRTPHQQAFEWPELAAVDLGSNSFRLEMAVSVHQRIERVEYLKETVRQGNGLNSRHEPPWMPCSAAGSAWPALANA